jgi:hypothetical protein
MRVGAYRGKKPMNLNKNTAACNHQDAGSTAFMATIKNACQPINAQVDVGSFKDKSPCEMKQLLDYFTAKHGSLQFWSLQNIMDTCAAECKVAEIETRKNHASDHAKLLRIYVDESATDDVVIAHHAGDAKEVADDEEAIDDETLMVRYESNDFTLNVHSCNMDDPFQSWAIASESLPIFASPLAKNIVYLELCSFSPDCRDFDIHMEEDAVYWLNGTELISAGYIDEILYRDIIVTSTGLIVPVVVIPDSRWPKPVDLMGSFDEDHDDDFVEMQNFLARANKEHTRDQTQLELIQDVPAMRPVPKIAIALESSLGNQFRDAADCAHHEARVLAFTEVPKRLRENLRAWNVQMPSQA